MDLTVIIPAYNEADGIGAVLRDVQSVVPDAELLAFPGARHGFNVEFEEQCNQRVIDFLKRQG